MNLVGNVASKLALKLNATLHVFTSCVSKMLTTSERKTASMQWFVLLRCNYDSMLLHYTWDTSVSWSTRWSAADASPVITRANFHINQATDAVCPVVYHAMIEALNVLKQGLSQLSLLLF